MSGVECSMHIVLAIKEIQISQGEKKGLKRSIFCLQVGIGFLYFLYFSLEDELCLLRDISGAASILREEMVLSLPCLSLPSLWNEGDGLWLTQSCKKQKGEGRCRPGNSYGFWAKLMSCSKCENAGAELMPRAFYCLLNVRYLPCVLTNGEGFMELGSLAIFIQDKEHCQH